MKKIRLVTFVHPEFKCFCRGDVTKMSDTRVWVRSVEFVNPLEGGAWTALPSLKPVCLRLVDVTFPRSESVSTLSGSI